MMGMLYVEVFCAPLHLKKVILTHPATVKT